MQSLIRKGGQAKDFDPVPEITKKHFEEAIFSSRRSVTDTDLNKFEEFKRKFDPNFVRKSGIKGSKIKVSSIKWPSRGQSKIYDVDKKDDEDIYS